jgi:hypothetical protein
LNLIVIPSQAVENAKYAAERARNSNRILREATSGLTETQGRLGLAFNELEMTRRELEAVKLRVNERAEEVAQERLTTHVPTIEASIPQHYEVRDLSAAHLASLLIFFTFRER